MQTLPLLRLGLWLNRHLPPPILQQLPYLFAALAWMTRADERRTIIANQRQILGGGSRARLQWQAYRVMVNVVRNYHALVRLHDLTNDEIRALVDLRGVEHLEAALAGGRGVMILGAHIGNYNVLAPFTALYGPPAGAFVEPVRPPELFDFVSTIRARTGLRLLPAGRDGAAAASRLLRENGILLVTNDRVLSASGASVEFFGRPAPLPQGAVVLALRGGVPILPATLRQLPHGRYLAHLRPPLPLVDTGRTREDVAANMRLVARALEETIGAAPEQWVMLNPVWPADPVAEAPVGAVQQVAHWRSARPVSTADPRAAMLWLGGVALIFAAVRPLWRRRNGRPR